MKTIIGAGCATIAAALAAPAAAQVIDQQQPAFNVERGFKAIGSSVDQKLAQTFTVGITGDLIAVDLPLLCNGDTPLIIEIREQTTSGAPDGAALRRARGDFTFYEPAELRRIYLPTALSVSAGDELAIAVLPDGDDGCVMAPSADGDLYPRGQGFFDTSDNPGGFLSLSSAPHAYDDWSFRTVMASAGGGRGSGDCLIPPSGSIPIPASTPVCRCLRDPGLREFRCAFLHPDFFMVRRIPWPLPPGQSFKEIWQVIPVAPLDGPVRLTLDGAGINGPKVYEFKPRGKSLDLPVHVVNATAPKMPIRVPGVATVEYPMQDAEGPEMTKFSIDRSLDPSHFGK